MSADARRGGIVGGVVLIAIGVIFLVGQMVPGIAWWSLWPLIVVLVGVVQMVTPEQGRDWDVFRLLDGLGTVFLGLVLLGNSLGFISWGVWWTFITLWPVLLIALGVSIVGRGLHQSWLRIIATLLVWLTLGYAVAMSVTGVGGLTPIVPFTQVYGGQTFAYSEPLNGATSATLTFKGGAGDIAIDAGTDLVKASGESPFGTTKLSVTRSGDSAAVGFNMGDSSHNVVVPGFGAGRVQMALSRSTVWDTTFETGATNLDADLSDVPVRRLVLKTGASSSTLKLGPVPESVSSTEVLVKAGVSGVTILVPANAEVRLDTHNGLSATDVDSSLVSRGRGVWQTPGYSSTGKAINIQIESGISSISVRTY